MKYGVIIKAIRGNTYFGKQDGTTVKSGVCCWFYGHWVDNKAGLIQFSYFEEPEL